MSSSEEETKTNESSTPALTTGTFRSFTRKFRSLHHSNHGSQVIQHPWTEEMIRLDTVIVSEKGVKLLITDLLPLPGDLVVKVRFIQAVDSLDEATIEEKKLLAQNIANTFLKKDMFSVPITEDVSKHLLEGKYQHFYEARRQVLANLSENEEVMIVVEKVESIEGV